MGAYTEITVTVPDVVGEDQINELFWRVIQVAQSFEESHPDRDWHAIVSAISGQKWEDDCPHCGQGPEPDGDHSCPCPYRDEECPDHV